MPATFTTRVLDRAWLGLGTATREVRALMEREPELAELNAHVVQKALHQL